jgi:hypothetical protein
LRPYIDIYWLPDISPLAFKQQSPVGLGTMSFMPNLRLHSDPFARLETGSSLVCTCHTNSHQGLNGIERVTMLLCDICRGVITQPCVLRKSVSHQMTGSRLLASAQSRRYICCRFVNNLADVQLEDLCNPGSASIRNDESITLMELMNNEG